MALGNRLRGGEKLVGSFVKSDDPNVAEAMAAAGFDLLIADLAHSSLGLREVEDIVRAAAVHGVPVLARIGPADLALAGRILETGAAGIQVTDVDSAELLGDLRAAVDFPPRGRRGLSLSHRAGGFGLRPADELIDGVALVITQLESRAGLERLAELLAAPAQPDAWFLGPTDLAIDLGHRGDAGHPEVVAALEEALATVLAAGLPAGIFVPEAAAARAWHARGATLLALSSDLTLLAAAARRARENS
ncbi:MAG: hypothetical protein JST59_28820 [Actinobacteria bacterium]|nr:hypothetical protein [Actinomycetota bacterium]